MMMARLRTVLFMFLVLAALAAMGYGQYGIRRNPEDAQATTTLLVAALAAAILLGREGASSSDSAAALVDAPPQPHVGGRIGVLLGVAGMVAGSVLLSLGWSRWFIVGWSLLLAGVGLASVGLRQFDPPSRPERSWSRPEIVLLVAVVLLGGFLRFYRYTEFPDPFGIHAVEEPQTGAGGYRILKDHVRPWEFMLDHYIAALGIYLRHDPSILSIRIPFTICSALAIIPVYLLLRQLVSIPAAFGGTFLFAVSSWNIIYSRCAHNIFLTNGLVVAVVALLIHFGRTRRLAGVPWVGLLSGYTLYAYAGYRGTSVYVLVFLAGVFLRDVFRYTQASDGAAKLTQARTVFRDLSAGAMVVTLIVALAAPIAVLTTSNAAQPNYYFEAAIRSLSNREYYTQDRSAFVAQRVERVRETARLFMHRGDGSLTFNEPNEPMLDPVTAVLFAGGLLLTVCYPWRRFNGFFIFLFVALLLGSAVFVQNLDPRRMQGITPLVALFAAFFLDRLWALAQRSHPVIRQRIVPLLVAAAAVFALWWNYDVYFRQMAHDPRVRQAFKNYYTTLIHYGRTDGEGRDIILSSDVHHFFERSDYSWMVEDVMLGSSVSDISELWPPRAFPPSRGRPRTIVIQHPHERGAITALLTQLYPGTSCKDFVEPDNPYIALTACDLPPQPAAQPPTMSLEARYWLQDAPAGEPFLVRREPFIAFALVPQPCYERTSGSEYCYAEWNGTFTVATEGEYEFVTGIRETTSIEVRIDGVALPPFPPSTGTRLHLSAGEHQLVAHARLPRTNETGAHLEWKNGTDWTLVPFYHVAPPSAAAAVPQRDTVHDESGWAG